MPHCMTHNSALRYTLVARIKSAKGKWSPLSGHRWYMSNFEYSSPGKVCCAGEVPSYCKHRRRWLPGCASTVVVVHTSITDGWRVRLSTGWRGHSRTWRHRTGEDPVPSPAIQVNSVAVACSRRCQTSASQAWTHLAFNRSRHWPCRLPEVLSADQHHHHCVTSRLCALAAWTLCWPQRALAFC